MIFRLIHLLLKLKIRLRQRKTHRLIFKTIKSKDFRGRKGFKVHIIEIKIYNKLIVNKVFF